MKGGLNGTASEFVSDSDSTSSFSLGCCMFHTDGSIVQVRFQEQDCMQRDSMG